MKARFIYDIPERKQPATQQLRDGLTWIVELPFWFLRANGELLFVPPSGIGTDADIIKNPAWTTDYGSIPKIFQNIFSPMKYGGSFLLHDWLYCSEGKSREEADQILYEALQAQGANWLTRQTIYRAVRLGGGLVWAKHRRKDTERLRSWAQYCRPLFHVSFATVNQVLHEKE